MKTNELTGVALDWAVAMCEGATDFWFDTVATHWVKLDGKDRALRYGWAQSYLPSTDWAQGGPIIERERLSVSPYSFNNVNPWVSHSAEGDKTIVGPTPLITVMRCYVASKLGNEVDVPELLQGEQP